MFFIKKNNLSSFKADKVTDMSDMFSKCSSLIEINLSSFKTKQETNMSQIFQDISKSCNIICHDKKILDTFKNN